MKKLKIPIVILMLAAVAGGIYYAATRQPAEIPVQTVVRWTDATATPAATIPVPGTNPSAGTRRGGHGGGSNGPGLLDILVVPGNSRRRREFDSFVAAVCHRRRTGFAKVVVRKTASAKTGFNAGSYLPAQFPRRYSQ